MNTLTAGRGLILTAAATSLVVPLVVDMFAQADLHLDNPQWLPHAKLHTAMSVHAAMALGAGSVALLVSRWKRPTVADLAITTFLATSFWIGLVLAGLWPGTAFSTANTPTDADAIPVLGLALDGNVVMAALAVAVGWLGFALAASALTRSDHRHQDAPAPQQPPAGVLGGSDRVPSA